MFFFTEQILGQLLAFDCKLVLSVYRQYFTMPNVDYINKPDFRSSVKSATDIDDDLTSMMRHYIKRILTEKSHKYGLSDANNMKAFYEFETSLLALRHVGFSKDDLMEIIQAELEGTGDDQDEDIDSIYSRL